MGKLNLEPMTEAQMKLCLLDILSYVDSWCNTHNIRYYLMYGTLLGAIRHKGFIPWDDDIDIAMPRKDYELFMRTFSSKDSNNRYSVVNVNNTRGYYLQFGKVVDNTTLLKEHLKGGIEIGVYIDIFPLDNLTREGGTSEECQEDIRHLIKRIKPYRDILNAKLHPWDKKRTLMRNVIAAIISYLPIPKKFLINKIDKIARYYENEENPEYIGVAVFNIYRGKEAIKAEFFREIKRMKFEGRDFNVPVGYDGILSRTYGDYMTPPPEKDRISHHDYEVYRLINNN